LSPDELIDRITDLAHEAAGDGTGLDPAGLQRLEGALGRRPIKRHARHRVAFAAGLAAVTGALLVAAWLRTRPLTFVVFNGGSGSSDYVVAGNDRTAVRFSDDSEIAMGSGCRMRIQHVDGRGARLMLEGGRLHVHTEPRLRAAWAIDAGPYVVHVAGTDLDMSWKPDEQTLDLGLRSGSITVEGPLADGSIHVVAGQRLVASARDGSVAVGDLDAPPVAETLPAASGAAASLPVLAERSGTAPDVRPAPAQGGGQAMPTPAVAPAVVVRSPAPAGSGWSAKLARGDFQAIVDEARQNGLDTILAEAPLADLAALADAARYSRRADVAQAALGAERRRFAGSAQAHDASFFLASLAEGSGQDAAALDGYETYLRESPSGSYASQALGRKLLLVQRLHGMSAARPVASAYLARYHDGPYAEYARKVLEMP
jgi:hypothetical protein